MRRPELSPVMMMAAVLCAGIGLSGAGGGKSGGGNAGATVSFKRDIMPVFHRYCLPCHTEEQANPSGFFADSYENLMNKAKHGPVVIAGKPDSSHLIQKLGPDPPFGDAMP